MENKKLTGKEVSFTVKIIEGLEPSEALKNSEYKTDNMNANTIKCEAQKLLNRPHIAHTMEQAKKEQIDAVILTRKEALEILTTDARAKEIMPADRHRAVKQVTDMQGWNAPKVSEISGPDGGPIRTAAELTDAELMKIANGDNKH
jgi:hypothetical protein